MPINLAIMDLIVHKADLLAEDAMPWPLLDACAHVEAYEPVIRRWEQGDFTDHVSLIPFPRRELSEYLSTTFASLKTEQSRLIRASRRRWV